MENLVLGYDIGGTKIAVGIIDSTGTIVDSRRELFQEEKGKDWFLNLLSTLASEYLDKFPQIQKIGIASAGPLHPTLGVLMNPTNMKTDGESWGEVPIVKHLQIKTSRSHVYLENDAAAAILAEHWLGQAKGVDNCMILTLGTGLGVGVITNGSLERSGRGLHPEAGHIPLNFTDKTAPSGSGCFGSAEAYLSGRNFVARVAEQWSEPGLTGEELVERALSKEKKALQAFDEYSEYMAQALNAYAVLYTPEVVVFSGGFSHAVPLFLDKTKRRLEELLIERRLIVDFMPELRVSEFQDEIGLIGAARVALTRSS